eukprot:gnl/MRDRNA2_/MRDRNA2_92825_c0_seq1.p1 gnl/MRDRNA2_/MRDRNA2_92825_c0~~gnl/MRDRNA2_/MRDRNA2_92825_c0_seq1.p1  ORF type:complete len:202 (+),score=40.73 gnl/MRDRNA2_/MRDRNA2_92825_c0_seq1:78-608(+)
MFARSALLLVLAAPCWAAVAGGNVQPDSNSDSDSCHYGYGEGCEHFWDETPAAPVQKQGIDQATKEKLKSILGGIISNLGGGKMGLITKRVSQDTQVSLTAGESAELKQKFGSFLYKLSFSKTDATAVGAIVKYLPSSVCPFGYGCGGGGSGLDPATKAQVANILKGIISNLSGKR